MHFDLGAIPASDAYKLLVSTVVPRPIALATTVDTQGRINAAPFSFFNAVSSIPPVVVLGISPGDPGSTGDGYKDTERNIRDTGEFVVNLVDPERYYVASEKMRLIGRMHGRGWYARTGDLFQMDRMTFGEWKDNKR